MRAVPESVACMLTFFQVREHKRPEFTRFIAAQLANFSSVLSILAASPPSPYFWPITKLFLGL
jgi:hypothetical protein